MFNWFIPSISSQTFFLGTMLAVEAKTLLSQQELRDFYSLIWHQGPQIMWRGRKQKVKSLWLFQVPATRGITMKGHLSFISNHPGIDFNSVHSAFPQNSDLPANIAKLKEIFTSHRKQGIWDTPLQSLKAARDVATVIVNMLEIYGYYDCGSGSLLKQT